MSDTQHLKDHLLQIELEIASLQFKHDEMNKHLVLLKKQKDEEKINLATENKDWKRLLQVDEENKTTVNQDKFWDTHILPVNKIFSRAGFYPLSKQVSFKLGLIDYSYNKDQIERLIPVVTPIIDNLQPVKIHRDVKELRVIPVFDRYKGANGSVSLIVNEEGGCAVYCENKTKPETRLGFTTLSNALVYIAKKHYFFG